MFARVVFLLFVAALVQSSVQSFAIEDPNNVELEGVIDDLKDIVYKGMNKTIKQLKDLGNELKDYVVHIVDDVKVEISEQQEDFIKEINQLKQRAKDLGVNITDCLKDKEQQLYGLPKVIIGRAVNCTTKEIKQGQALIEEAKQKINHTITKVDDLKAEYNACPSGVKGALCKAKVAAKIAKAGISLPVKLTDTILEASKLLSTVHISVTICAKQQFDMLVADGQGIVDDVASCVEDKVNSKPDPQL